MEKLNKVASITFAFWIMKILATTLGETLGDLMSMTLNIGYLISLGITFAIFMVFLFIQVKSSKFIPALFWIVVVGTTTVGTEISDFMDRTLGLGYALGSSILFSILMLTLIFWYFKEKSIIVFPITDKKVEIYYWVAVLFSNSLGTAFGDFLSDNLGLSYLNGAFVTAGIIILVLILHYLTKINQVVLFWIAFIFTRPFGATFGDLLTKKVEKGGLDLGTIPSTIITTILLGLCVFFTYRRNKSNS
jgi:uncharacterized membrane-anchored protein